MCKLLFKISGLCVNLISGFLSREKKNSEVYPIISKRLSRVSHLAESLTWPCESLTWPCQQPCCRCRDHGDSRPILVVLALNLRRHPPLRPRSRPRCRPRRLRPASAAPTCHDTTDITRHAKLALKEQPKFLHARRYQTGCLKSIAKYR